MAYLPHLNALLGATLFALCPLLNATVYYIDFEQGSDTAAGTSPTAAWKHSPGDANASGKPAATVLQAGDTVVFKGGVTYSGSITLSHSGKEGAPITLDGNSGGTFGQGRAILSGSNAIDNWQQLSDASMASNNPLWQQLFYADIDVDLGSNFNQPNFVLHRKAPQQQQAPWQRIILLDSESGPLPVSQSPDPSDPFYPDIPADFHKSPTPVEVSKEEGTTRISDPRNLSGKPADAFKDYFVGLQAGNNHVFFSKVKAYDPASGTLTAGGLTVKPYPTTSYALYNSPSLITKPGQWAISPLEGGRSRIFLLPPQRKDNQPLRISYPELQQAVVIEGGASHIAISGFLIEGYSGGAGGISVSRANTRSGHITISNCEIRHLVGHAGIGLNHCDNVVVENCTIYHNPGWTTGIFMNRVNHFTLRNNTLNKNSGSGIRHYESKEGLITGNVILDHFGMHSSSLNFYEGCANIVFERNYLNNTLAINRSATNIVLRNNVINGLGKASVGIALWGSGSVGGRGLKDIHLFNNTIVNFTSELNWSSGIFGQTRKGVNPVEGLVVRNNVMDRPRGALPGTFEGNIFTRAVTSEFADGNVVVTDWKRLFVDADKGDFRRRPGSPQMETGADIPPPALLPNAR